MPKKDILHKGGRIQDKEIIPFLLKYFSTKDIEKLERFGGRIQISITAPFKVIDKKKPVKIDENFKNKLISKKDDIKALERLLEPLTVKQMVEICKSFKVPVKSKPRVHEIRNTIISFLQS